MSVILKDLFLVSATCGAAAVLMIAVSKLIGKYAGAWWRMLVWMAIMLRLCIPVMISSPLSLYSPEAAKIFARIYPAAEEKALQDENENAAPRNADEQFSDEGAAGSEYNPTADYQPPEPGEAAGKSPAKEAEFDWRKLIGCVYLAGLIFSLAVFFIKCAKLKREISSLPRCRDKRVNDILRRLKKEMNIKRKVWVYKSHTLPVPAVTGIFLPRILLPENAADGVSAKHLEMILRHELTHHKRGDILKLMLADIVSCIHWFNPIIHISKLFIRHDIELACDEKIISSIKKSNIIEYSQVLAMFSAKNRNKISSLIMANFSGKGGKKIKERLTMMSNFKRRRNQVLGTFISLFLVLMLAACTTIGGQADDAPPEKRKTAETQGPENTAVQTPENTDKENAQPTDPSGQTSADSGLLEIYLAEAPEGTDPWDNANLDDITAAGQPLMTSEHLAGYYIKCDRENYPAPSDYGEAVPGENDGRSRIYYNAENNFADEFYANFESAGGESGKLYGILFVSNGQKLMCGLYDTGSGRETPKNAQIGLSVGKDNLFLWGAFGEFDFSGILSEILPAEMVYTPERLRQQYDEAAKSTSLSDLLPYATAIDFYSGTRDKEDFTDEQMSEISSRLEAAEYSCRSYEMTEEQRELRGSPAMSLALTFERGTASIDLYEDMQTIGVHLHRESRWAFFDEVYYTAPELVTYLDSLSQKGMPKLFELSGITSVDITKGGETINTITAAGQLRKIEKYLSQCRRKPLDNMHGSEYEIIITAGGSQYSVSPDENISDALFFDGHQYKAPEEFLEMLGVK